MAATSPEILADHEGTGAPRRAGDGHIAALTGLRGFAAIVVVFVHGSSLTAYPWIGLHGYGPIALFTLSGFLLFQPWSRWILGVGHRPSLRTFARRRFWRIFPAYLVVLLVVTLIHPPSRPDGLRQWWHAVTLTSIYDPAGRLAGLEHTWSLGTELTWYLVLPIVGLVLWQLARSGVLNPIPAVAALFGLSVVIGGAWRWWTAFHVDEYGQKVMFPTWLPAYMACFIGGALIGHLVIAHLHGLSQARALRWFGSQPWLVLGVAAGTAILGHTRLGGPWTFSAATFSEVTFRVVMCTVTALTLLAGIAAANPASPVPRLFATNWLEALGRWSYGIYLWHMPLVAIAWEQGLIAREGVGFVVWLASLVAISTGLGALTYRFIERPAIAWSKGVHTPKWRRPER